MGAPLHGKWTAFIKFLHSASPAQLPESLSYKKPAHKHTQKPVLSAISDVYPASSTVLPITHQYN